MTERVALITGCGKPDGAGQGVARALAAHGATVVVSDRRPAGVPNRRQEVVGSEQPEAWHGLDTLVTEIESAGGRAMSVLGDIGDERESQAMVDAAVAPVRAARHPGQQRRRAAGPRSKPDRGDPDRGVRRA